MNNTNSTELAAGTEIGVPPKGVNMAAVDLNKEIPALVPAKNWQKGVTVGGKYLGTERVVSEKFVGNKRDSQGRKYRDLHTMLDANGNEFSIWSVGLLGQFFSRLPIGATALITYTGLAATSIRPGESPAHEFTYQVAEGVKLLSKGAEPANVADEASATGRAAGMENAQYAN